MPKQPLHKNFDQVLPIMIGPQTFEQRPKLAVYVAQVIAGWTQVELALVNVLARFARKNLEQSVDMYLALDGFANQGKVLDAAAKTALTTDNLALYSAVMRFIKQSYNIRNEMAHWGWGVTDTLPDALIIFDPVPRKKLDGLIFNLIGQDMRIIGRRIAELENESKESIFIYREGDLIKCAKDMFHAEIYADRLQQLSSTKSDIDEARNIFLKEPMIKQFYESTTSHR